MTNWKPGDIALCVRGGKISNYPISAKEYPKTGAKYTVERVGMEEFSGEGVSLGLWLKDGPLNVRNERVWAASRFIKITPEEADEFDKETIDLYNNAPKVTEKA